MTLTEQVNECPFCHGHVRVQLFDRVGYAAVCSGCGASGPERPGYLAAVNEWNDYVKEVLEGRMMKKMETFGGLTREQVREFSGLVEDEGIKKLILDLVVALERAKRERDASKEDAERYRWLREPQEHSCVQVEGYNESGFTNNFYTTVRTELDTVIDTLRDMDGGKIHDARVELDAWRTAVEDEENCDLFEDGVAGDLHAAGIRTLTGAWMDGRMDVLRSIRENVKAAIDAAREGK